MLSRLLSCFCLKKSVSIDGSTYAIRDKLGEGGFSTVHLVECRSTHKQYALKKLACHSSEDLQTALREVQYHRQLQHPHIAQCLGSREIQQSGGCSHVILLLPFHPFGTLDDELQRRAARGQHLSEPTALRVFSALCDAVRCMHEARPEPLAHRDLKPANVLLTDSQLTPLLIDLGSVTEARVEMYSSVEAARLQDVCAERCSMLFRPPELFHVQSGHRIDERTDIWSLGCLLYAMCYFKSPFESVYERGDSIALAGLSGSVHIPHTSPYSQALVDMMLNMLTVDMLKRPFIQQVQQSVDRLLAEVSSHTHTDVPALATHVV